MAHYLVKKQVFKPYSGEYTTLNGGDKWSIDFEYSPVFGQEPKSYQFVYVKNGEYPHGTSMPFKFGSYPGEWSLQGEIQKLQHGLISLEQQQHPAIMSVGGGEWLSALPKVHELEQLLIEQAKIEQAHHRIEQLTVLAQLKHFERELVQHELRRQDDFELRQKLREFEQKVINVSTITPTTLSRPVEYYIQKYEQIFKEKLAHESIKKQTIQHKLRQKLKEFERKLVNVQQQEKEYYTQYYQQLKQNVYNKQELIKEFLLQQHQEKYNRFVKPQQELNFELMQMFNECNNGEVPSTVIPFTIPTELRQVEEQLQAFKHGLRLRLQGGCGVDLVSELTREIGQKLREIQWQLRQYVQQQQPKFNVPAWFEQRLEKLTHYINYTTNYETIPTQTQKLWWLIKEIDAELEQYTSRQTSYVIPQSFYGKFYPQIQDLKTYLREKMHFNLKPIEYLMIQTPTIDLWKQLMQYERKLAQFKVKSWEKFSNEYINTRLFNFQQQQKWLSRSGAEQQYKVGKLIELLRQLINKQYDDEEHFFYYGYLLHPEYYTMYQETLKRVLQVLNGAELYFFIQQQKPEKFWWSHFEQQLSQYALFMAKRRVDALVHKYKQFVGQVGQAVMYETTQFSYDSFYTVVQPAFTATPFTITHIQQLRQKLQEIEQFVQEQEHVKCLKTILNICHEIYANNAECGGMMWSLPSMRKDDFEYYPYEVAAFTKPYVSVGNGQVGEYFYDVTKPSQSFEHMIQELEGELTKLKVEKDFNNYYPVSGGGGVQPVVAGRFAGLKFESF